jgi:3,8-divinyl chlorophyllide a/chlorophyllide a reductase subunit X
VSVTLLDRRALVEEAHQEPDPVHTGEVTKETQVIAIYGKGGSGKSFALSNLSYMMAQQGKRVLLIGCDPKSDTTSLLFGGKSCPTIIETSSKKKLAGEEVKIEDVCFVRDGVFAMELGGPEVGRGCGGRGIIHGFELLEKLGFHDWGFDYVLLDFLGDVVCGGFGLPIARDMCQKVIVVGSNDLQSLYVANNVCSAVEYFRKLGGNVGVAGMLINKDDGTGEAQAFADAVGIPVLAANRKQGTCFGAGHGDPWDNHLHIDRECRICLPLWQLPSMLDHWRSHLQPAHHQRLGRWGPNFLLSPLLGQARHSWNIRLRHTRLRGMVFQQTPRRACRLVLLGEVQSCRRLGRG